MVSLVVSLGSFAGCAPHKVDLAVEEAAVRARSEGVTAAEVAKDRQKALTFWAPEAIIQAAGAPQIQGRDAIDRLYRQFFDSIGLKTFSGKSTSMVLSQSGDMAYETGINRMTFGTPKGDVLDVGKYLAVWKKMNGTWYVTALSFTSDAPVPVPVPNEGR